MIEEPFHGKTFSGSIETRWKISSFSSLTSSHPHVEEWPDRDALDPSLKSALEILDEEVETEIPKGLFAFPKGTRTGILFHDLLEHLDFAASDTEIKDLVNSRLIDYGFDGSWTETLCQMVTRVLHAQLDPNFPDMSLSYIENSKRLCELEFYFPLKTISAENLRQIIKNHGGKSFPAEFPTSMERLNFSPVQGFMKGYIDLLFQWNNRFFLVDWKSNFLGATFQDYDQSALTAAMQKDFYVLQYIIYTLAVDQYLRLRLPNYHYDKHFGGVYYIFLRGVNRTMGPEYGIYRDLPDPNLIKALREALIDSPVK
jgi:exodeoxyribonuclease V beta subunit